MSFEWEPTTEGPYQPLVCGDAGCVLDAEGHLAWHNVNGKSSPLSDKDTAIQCATAWNEQYQGTRH